MFRKGLEMFRFPVVKSSLRFPNLKIVAVPATSFVNNLHSCRSSILYSLPTQQDCVLPVEESIGEHDMEIAKKKVPFFLHRDLAIWGRKISPPDRSESAGVGVWD